MKSLRLIPAALMLLASSFICSCDDNDDEISDLEERVESIEERVTALENLCSEMNTNIASLQTLVTALENNDYITSIVEVTKDGEVIGYTITFLYSDPITIYNGSDGTDGTDGTDGADGEDGQDGSDGSDGSDGTTPIIGIALDTDGVYYWTLNGEWLLADDGSKVKAVGTDGEDGQDGTDGTNGTNGTNGSDGADGADGVTPQLKIEDGYWYVSYDNGSTWTKLSSASSSSSTDCLFSDISISDEYVTFTLSSGEVITLSIYQSVKIEIDVPEEVDVYYGCTTVFTYTLTNATEGTVVTVSTAGGLTASLSDQTVDGGTITITYSSSSDSGCFVNLIVVDENGYVQIKVINFYLGEVIITDSTYYFSAAGGDVSIDFTTNFEAVANLISGEDWITINNISRAEYIDNKLNLTIEPNTSGEDRIGEIGLTSSYTNINYKTISIYQPFTDFNIDQSEFEVDVEGGYVSVNIYSIDGVSYQISSDCDWISVTETQYSDNGQSLYLVLLVDQNLEYNARSQEIEIYNALGNSLLGTISITQDSEYSDEDPIIFVASANPDNDYTVSLPIYYQENTYPVDCIVDWGDGTIEEYSNTSEISHTYSGLAEETEFQIRVFGTVVYLNGSEDIVEIKQWGTTGLEYIFFSGSNLKTIPSDTCGSLENAKSVSFADCTSLEEIPEGLFEYGYNITYVSFNGCTKIEIIPSGLFSNCSALDIFDYTFANCSSLVSIPEDMFYAQDHMPFLIETFYACTSLTSIPENLFSKTTVEYFLGVFEGCTALESIPDKLFYNNVNTVSFEYIFRNCTSLKTIPESLFENNIYTNYINYTFYGCTSLESVPVTIFDNCKDIIVSNSTFYGCSSLTGESPYTIIDGEKIHLYERINYLNYFSEIVSNRYCFTGCTNLTDYADIPDDWK